MTDVVTTERRCESRVDIGNEVALVDTGEGSEPQTCCIWNVSRGGACLMFPADLPLPPTFDIRMKSGSRKAVQIWRQWTYVGVKFVE
jgi:hypothetical protein